MPVTREDLENLLDAVADEYGVTRYDLLSRSMGTNAGQARNEFWWRMFNDLNVSREDIAKTFKRPLRTIQAAIASRAKEHGMTTETPDQRATKEELIRLLKDGTSFQEISDRLGYSTKSLPTLAFRLKAHYPGIRATPERPAIPPHLTKEYRRLMTAENLTPAQAAKRLKLTKTKAD